MATSLDEALRPRRMMSCGRKPNPKFGESEFLYRRCDSQAIANDNGELRIIGQKAFEQHNPSTVRSAYARPDHSRWDSARDPEARPGFQPKLYRDWYVVAVKVADVETPAGGFENHEFFAAHTPYDDNYGHSEIHVRKAGVLLKDHKKFNKPVRAAYRTWLGDRASVCLAPQRVYFPKAGDWNVLGELAAMIEATVLRSQWLVRRLLRKR